MYELNSKIRDLTPYKPLAGEYKIRLDANESFLPLPEDLKNAAADAVLSVPLNRYPDPTASALCRAFAARYDVPFENVAAGNGSDELISVIMQSFLMKGDAYAVVLPDFSMYNFYGYVSECRAVEIEKDGFWKIDVDKVIETCNNENVKLLIFSNPCNPTGQGLCREEVRRLIKGVRALVVLDEAYMDFWDETMLPEFAAYDNLLILKTCSKAFGLAALRVGFAVGDEKLVRAIKAVKSPYNVNSLSQAFAKCVLEDGDACDRAFSEIRASKAALETGLRALAEKYPAIEIRDSVTNFAVVKSEKAEAIFRYLLENSIAVRYFKNMSALRITAGTAEENEAVLAAIEKFFKT